MLRLLSLAYQIGNRSYFTEFLVPNVNQSNNFIPTQKNLKIKFVKHCKIFATSLIGKLNRTSTEC